MLINVAVSCISVQILQAILAIAPGAKSLLFFLLDFALLIQSYTSWGGSVIKADDGEYHMFAAVFAGHQGLGKWSSTSEIMHLVSQVPEGPFTPVSSAFAAIEWWEIIVLRSKAWF